MKKLFRGNAGEHMLALTLALVLWFFVKSTLTPLRPDDTVTRSFTGIVLESRNRPQDMEVMSQAARAVTLTLRGSPQIMDRVAQEDLLAYIDMRSLDEGSHQLSVRVDLPAGLEVTAVSPARIEVQLERIISTQTTVSLVTTGEVAEGFFAPQGDIEPDVVLVTGPRSAVNQLAAFFIVVDLQGAQASRGASVKLVPLDPEGDILDNLSISPEQVQYNQPVFPIREVPVAVELGGEGAEDYEVRFDPLFIKLAGPVSILDGLGPLTIFVQVDDFAEESLEIDVEVPVNLYLIGSNKVKVLLAQRDVED